MWRCAILLIVFFVNIKAAPPCRRRGCSFVRIFLWLGLVPPYYCYFVCPTVHRQIFYLLFCDFITNAKVFNLVLFILMPPHGGQSQKHRSTDRVDAVTSNAIAVYLNGYCVIYWHGSCILRFSSWSLKVLVKLSLSSSLSRIKWSFHQRLFFRKR